jgi:hypothetical protein
MAVGTPPPSPQGAPLDQKQVERVGNRDWWFFGVSLDQEDRFVHLRLFHASSVKIVRHIQVKCDVNPYDRRWAAYLAQRTRRRSKPTVSGALSPSCAVWSDPEDVADLDWIGSHIWLTI